MPTPAELAFIEAIQAGYSPEQIQQYAAGQGSVPHDVAANPSAFGYDYRADPVGGVPTRNLAFTDSDNYDYRNDPSWMALDRNFNAQDADIADRLAHDTGQLKLLQP